MPNSYSGKTKMPLSDDLFAAPSGINTLTIDGSNSVLLQNVRSRTSTLEISTSRRRGVQKRGELGNAPTRVASAVIGSVSEQVANPAIIADAWPSGDQPMLPAAGRSPARHRARRAERQSAA